MSFSTEVKNNLARIIPDTKEEQISELSGMIRVGATLRFVGRGLLSFVITIENPAVCRKIVKIIKQCFRIRVEISVKKNENLKKRFYTISIPEDEKANMILIETGILVKNEEFYSLTSKIPNHMLSIEENRNAYIRGVFLGGGSVGDPAKSYHMEFVTSDDEFAEHFKNMLNEHDLHANVTKRKTNNVVYVKDSSHIALLLALMGDFENTCHMESVKIEKQVRNQINRIVNCETANINKTVNSAGKQIESIRYIQDTVGLSELSEELQQIAKLRLEYPYASLRGLGEQLEIPLGRSAVNHRLKKIQQFAEKIKELEEK